MAAECAICLTDLDNGGLVTQLPCTHEFHRPCVNTWLMQNPSCPECRADASAAVLHPCPECGAEFTGPDRLRALSHHRRTEHGWLEPGGWYQHMTGFRRAHATIVDQIIRSYDYHPPAEVLRDILRNFPPEDPLR